MLWILAMLACGVADETPETSDLTLALNEVDAAGDPDWVELVNYGDSDVDLSGLTLSDGGDAYTLTGTLAAGAFLVVLADDGEEGAPFKLSGDGETLVLADSSGATVDSVAFPAVTAGTTWGRVPDGTGVWALTEASAGAANAAYEPEIVEGCEGSVSDVVINELLSHGSSSADYIELYNTGDACVTVGGLHLSDDEADLTATVLPEGWTLEPGAFTVIWADDGTDEGHANFKLSSGGETVYFSDADGVLVESVAFPALEEDVSWSRLPDGTGAFALGEATPGAANTAQVIPDGCEGSVSDVVINELLSNGSSSADYIELYNTGDACVTVGGLHLSDDEAAPEAYSFPAGLTLEAGAFAVIWADEGTEEGHANFKLSSGGETVYFSDADGVLVESVAFPALEEDVSWSRLPDGEGVFGMAAATPGVANEV